MKNLSLKPFTAVAGVLAGLQGVIHLIMAVSSMERSGSEYFTWTGWLEWSVVPALAWLSLAAFLLVLASKQK